ncbi:hypothetical protein C8Q76DRAFT_796780 [Earliella scabrosa]|nr:hypothetical protein C8Q76DRAFT_796780 [Earliella scabrosa]
MSASEDEFFYPAASLEAPFPVVPLQFEEGVDYEDEEVPPSSMMLDSVVLPSDEDLARMNAISHTPSRLPADVRSRLNLQSTHVQGEQLPPTAPLPGDAKPPTPDSDGVAHPVDSPGRAAFAVFAGLLGPIVAPSAIHHLASIQPPALFTAPAMRELILLTAHQILYARQQVALMQSEQAAGKESVAVAQQQLAIALRQAAVLSQYCVVAPVTPPRDT